MLLFGALVHSLPLVRGSLLLIAGATAAGAACRLLAFQATGGMGWYARNLCGRPFAGGSGTRIRCGEIPLLSELTGGSGRPWRPLNRTIELARAETTSPAGL